MHCNKACGFVFVLIINLVSQCNFANGNSSVLVIIRDQSNHYHQKLATAKKADLDAQIAANDLNAKVILMQTEYPVEPAWTVLPVLPDIARKYADDFEWFMFIEEGTNVDLKLLTKSFLTQYDPAAFKLLCRCLYDDSPTIIHHFAFFNGNVKKFKFPDFDAGWIWSRGLLQKVALKWDSKAFKSDFQIDIKHEIAMFLDKTHDIKVSCVDELCGAETHSDCLTYIDKSLPQCGNKVTLDNVLVSVKTTLKFHTDRVPVVQKTWGKYVKNIRYYSNVTDPTIPTMDCGVPNTASGHCGKMEKIILDAYELPQYDWLIIADDDSIIGISRMMKLLNCYDPNKIVVLGERYGFGLLSGYGYGYITGGGSMIMSKAALKAWKENQCECPSIDTPDDMFLGQCFSFRVGVPVTHSPLFHQARPDDYADDFLSNQMPISFHKHWEVDPYEVYKRWFQEDDKLAYDVSNYAPTQAPEPQVIPIPPTPTEHQVRDEL